MAEPLCIRCGTRHTLAPCRKATTWRWRRNWPVTEYFYFPCRAPKTKTDWRNVWDFCHNEERFQDYAETHGLIPADALRREQRELLQAYMCPDKSPRRTAKQKAESAERSRKLAERIDRERAQAQALAVVVDPQQYAPGRNLTIRTAADVHAMWQGSVTLLDGRPAR